MPPTRRTTLAWDRVEPGPLILVSGPEELLGERAVARLIALDKQANPEAEVTWLDASDPRHDSLAEAASGSLFAERMVVVVQAVELLTETFQAEALAYVADPNCQAMVIFRHKSGLRGKKLLDALRQAKVPEVSCQVPKYPSDKVQFVVGEWRMAERLADREAVQALVDALGTDLSELAAACSQIAADTEGRITKEMVDRYYGGRLEATGFAVADAAVTGDLATAIALARHAMAAGTEPLALVGALAMKLRGLAKVAGAGRAGLDPVKDLKMASWQVDRAKRELRHWDAQGLGVALRAVGRADAEAKGIGATSSKVARGYAVERAIVVVASPPAWLA